MELSSTAFQDGDTIPRRYSADGENISPPLKWIDPPEKSRGFGLVCEDPDAPRGTFNHWVAFNLPAESRELAEGVLAQPELPNGTRQGTNDFGKVGYGGPSPPPGKPHRYVFKLFALDSPVQLKSGSTKEQLLEATQGHVLAEAELIGVYGRSD